METEGQFAPLSTVLVFILVIAPIGAGALLFVLFKSGPVHDLGLFLIGAGVIVGGALFLMGRG